MYKYILIAFSFFHLFSCTAQKPAVTDIPVHNHEFQEKLRSLLRFSTPTISVEDAQKNKTDYVFLDAREKTEFDVSHIPGAKWIGYDDFSKERLNEIPKDSKVIVYCSVGYRSEKITEKLQKYGYTESYNLIGSIFEWTNQKCPLEDKTGKTTDQVHTYNKKWSQWVNNPEIEKIW